MDPQIVLSEEQPEKEEEECFKRKFTLSEESSSSEDEEEKKNEEWRSLSLQNLKLSEDEEEEEEEKEPGLSIILEEDEKEEEPGLDIILEEDQIEEEPNIIRPPSPPPPQASPPIRQGTRHAYAKVFEQIRFNVTEIKSAPEIMTDALTKILEQVYKCRPRISPDYLIKPTNCRDKETPLQKAPMTAKLPCLSWEHKQEHLMYAFQETVVSTDEDLFTSERVVTRYKPCANGAECKGITARLYSDTLLDVKQLFGGAVLPAFFLPGEDFSQIESTRVCVLCHEFAVTSAYIALAARRVNLLQDLNMSPMTCYFNSTQDFNDSLLLHPSEFIPNGLISSIAVVDFSRMKWSFDEVQKRWFIDISSYRAGNRPQMDNPGTRLATNKDATVKIPKK